MIYNISEGDTSKYEQVSLINDIDDFFLWSSFKNRASNIEKYFMDKNSGTSSNTVEKKVVKKVFSDIKDIPNDLLKKFCS